MELRGLRDPGLARTIKFRDDSVWALAALGALTVLRLVIAASLPLAPDEAYYWVWSRALAPGYPDHPPMVALWIRIGTMIAGDTALGIRLLGPLSIAAATLLLADAAERMLPGRRAGLHAAALLNATLLFGAGSVLMTPDAPLLAFWAACIWAIARLLDSERPYWWIGIGLFAGLALVSKYTAALLWFGIAAWLLISPRARAWLKSPWPWAGAVVGLAIFSPVVAWEASHNWPSFVRQGSRITAWHPGESIRFLGELFAGQIGLATPLVFAFCAAGIWMTACQTRRTLDPVWTLLASLTVPATALFMEHAMGDRVQGNWPDIIYPAAAIAAGGLIRPVWHKLLWPAVGLGLGITFLVYLQATLAPLPLPVRFDPIARQLAGWQELAAQVEAVRRQTGAAYIVADQYGVASQLARNLPAEVTLVGDESRWALMRLPPARIVGQVGLLVQSAAWRELNSATWQMSGPIATAERRRGAETIESFPLYKVVLTQDSADAVLLPRPR